MSKSNTISDVVRKVHQELHEGDPQQFDLFTDTERIEKQDQLETTVEDIRRRFWKRAICAAALMGNLKMPDRGNAEVIMPGMMYS